jgi:hypothetical protein
VSTIINNPSVNLSPVLLGRTTLAAGAVNVCAVTGLVTTSYDYLQVKIRAVCTATASSNITMQFNADAGNNYYQKGGGGATDTLVVGYTCITANTYAFSMLDVTNISAKMKAVTGTLFGSVITNLVSEAAGGFWNNIATTITSVEIKTPAGNLLTTGTVVEVYGVPRQ